MTIDIITDHTMFGCCPTAIRHAQDANYLVLGVCVTGPLGEDEPYDSDAVDSIVSGRLGVPCSLYGEGDDDGDGNTATPIVATLVGWSDGDGSGHDGYRIDDYFRDGKFVGPDQHGIEPIFGVA